MVAILKASFIARARAAIGGQIQGKVVSEGLLIIEEEACVEADIVVDEVIVLGKINGKLRANKRIELCENSHFQGEITTPALVIKEGARFDGHATMSEVANRELSAALQKDVSQQAHEPQLNAADTPATHGQNARCQYHQQCLTI